MGASPHAPLPARPPCSTHQGVRYLVSRMATVNTVPYSPASSGRIHSSQRQFGPRIPVRRIPKRDSGCVARADAAFARRRRSSWRLCDNQCGEAGQKRTKYVTLIRGRAVAARGALRRFLSLVGVTSRIARAKLPNLAQGTHWMASPHAQTIRQGQARRDISLIGKSIFKGRDFSGCQLRQNSRGIDSEHRNWDTSLAST